MSGVFEEMCERLERLEALVIDLAERPAVNVPAPSGGPKRFTPEEAAAELKISKQTLALWRANGGGPAFSKVGSQVRYHRDDLASFMREHRQEARQ